MHDIYRVMDAVKNGENIGVTTKYLNRWISLSHNVKHDDEEILISIGEEDNDSETKIDVSHGDVKRFELDLENWLNKN